MNNTVFEILWDNDIVKSINDLTKESSKLKIHLFRSKIMGENINIRYIDLYKSYVNNFLKMWADYANALKDQLKNIKGISASGITSIGYDYVKDFVYNTFDYASIIQFTDGLFKGIKENKFKTNDDIEMFFNHTADIAYKNQANSVGGVIDSVLYSGIGELSKTLTNVLESNKFNSIRTYKNLFNDNERKELYKSITTVIDYIVREFDIVDIGKSNNKVYIGCINNIIEYITYSLTIYACRIAIIAKYSAPFITLYKQSFELKESTIHLDDISENPNGEISSVFSTMDEYIIKDIHNLDKFLCEFKEFMKNIDISINTICNNKNISDAYPSTDEGNIFNLKLKNNGLYDLILNSSIGFGAKIDSRNEYCVREFNQCLKTHMYNRLQGLDGTVSCRDEMMTTIRDMKCRETVEGYKELVTEIYHFTVFISKRIKLFINILCDDHRGEFPEGYPKFHHIIPSHDISVEKLASQSISILTELYEELMFTIKQKLTYIEKRINELRQNEIKDLYKQFELDIPGMKSDVSQTHYTMLSVPDTTRISLEDIYALPTYEYLQMYDEYLSSLPEFENDLYFSEAVNISNIINTIISHLKSVWQRFMGFINNKQFASAVQWVTANESRLMSMDFSSAEPMIVLPYKTDITLPQGFNNLINNLKMFDVKSLNSNETIQAYIKTLYPNDTVSGWFANDDPKVAAQKFKNLILFQDINTVNANNIQPIQLPANQIPIKLKEWISNIKKFNQTKNEMKTMTDQIQTSLNLIKSKVNNIVNNSQSNNTTQNTSSNTTPQTAQPNTSTSTQNTNQTANTSNNTAAMASTGLTKIMNSIDRLWTPVPPMLIQTVLDQYNYVKDAYTRGRGGSAGNASANASGEL